MMDNSWITEVYLSEDLNFIYLKTGFDGHLSQEYIVGLTLAVQCFQCCMAQQKKMFLMYIGTYSFSNGVCITGFNLFLIIQDDFEYSI